MEQDAIALSFRQYFAAQEVESKEVTFPTTWVDAVLDRFSKYFPPAWKGLFFIKYTTVKLEAKIMYPHVMIQDTSARYLIFKDERNWVKQND